MSSLARAIDAIPVVASATERDLLYPTPQRDQRVQIRTTGALQRYTGTAWTTDAPGAGAINVDAFGAVGDGVTDSTAAFQAAHDALPAAGGILFIPPGVYLIDSLQITRENIAVTGGGMLSTIVRRRTDSTAPLIWFNGARGSTMYDITLQDVPDGQTNTGNLLELYVVNDMLFSNVWLQFGHTLAYIGFECGNVAFDSCIFESGRRFNVHTYQAFDVRFTGCTFYTPGRAAATVAAPHDGTGASLRLESNIDPAAGYTWYSTELNVTGCTFINTNIGHHILASNVAGLTISGNNFGGAGVFDAGNYDEVKLEGSRYVVITGNTSASELDGYSSTKKARYNVNIDADCRNIVVGPNSFKAGLSGIVNDLAPDTVIASQIGVGPRKQLVGTGAYDYGPIAVGAVGAGTLTVTGAAVGDPVTAGITTLTDPSVTVAGIVTAPDTVHVTVYNGSGASLDLTPGTIKAVVFKL